MGRKRLLQINLLSFVVGLTILILSVNLYMAAVGLLFSCLGISNGFIICFYFIIETVSDDKR
jgi:predicted MFS family arabinose efflux permease